jgi:hypothetical protein
MTEPTRRVAMSDGSDIRCPIPLTCGGLQLKSSRPCCLFCATWHKSVVGPGRALLSASDLDKIAVH